MDHIVYLDAGSLELENLLQGNKSMLIRAASGRKDLPRLVYKGDTLYFVNNNCKSEIKAKGKVSTVIRRGNLTVEESFETIIRNQHKLQLPDNQFEEIAGMPFLILIGLEGIESLLPVRFDKGVCPDSDGWFHVGSINNIIVSEKGIKTS